MNEWTGKTLLGQLLGSRTNPYSQRMMYLDSRLPIVLGRFAGGQHVARANRVCTHCGSVAVADELHMIFECPALQAVRKQYASLFSTDTDTMRSFFAQQDIPLSASTHLKTAAVRHCAWDVAGTEWVLFDSFTDDCLVCICDCPACCSWLLCFLAVASHCP